MYTVLRCKINNVYYAIPAQYVKKIFMLKNTITPLQNLRPYIIGSVLYDKKIYLLLCLEQLLKNKPCSLSLNKPAIVLEYKAREYAFVVDEILELDEVKKEYREGNNLYSKDGIIYQEFSIHELFKKIDIANFSQKDFRQKVDKTDEESSNYLLFSIAQELYAIEDRLIYTIDHYNTSSIQDIYSHWIDTLIIYKNRPLKLASLAKYLHKKSTEHAFIIIRTDDKELAFKIEDIIGLITIDNNTISFQESDSEFQGYFLFENKIVHLFSSTFFLNTIKEYGLHITLQKNNLLKKEKDTQDFLIVTLFEKKYAIPLEYIVAILSHKQTNIRKYSSSNAPIAGLLLYKNTTYYLLDLGEVFNQKQYCSDDSRVIILSIQNNSIAITVDEIDTIVSIPSSHIAHLSNSDSISNGVLIDKNIPIFNLHWKQLHLCE